MNAADVQARLEEAGATLLALPRTVIGPRFATMSWDVIHSATEAYGWNATRVRPALPDGTAIDRMDEALAWVAIIKNPTVRRVLQARLMIDPVHGGHWFTWRQIGRMLGADYRAVQRWHHAALVEIAAALTADRRDG